jgi:hypothetical protein
MYQPVGRVAFSWQRLLTGHLLAAVPAPVGLQAVRREFEATAAPTPFMCINECCL